MTLMMDTVAMSIPALSRMSAVRLVAAGPALWRVVDRGGRVIGHLQALHHGGDVRYAARRFHAASRAFRELGEFWSADDAVECMAFDR